MSLVDLPSDIITLLPIYLHSITDLYALLRTCRSLYHAYAYSQVKLPPILPKLYGQPLLPPHPHLILAWTARQVADWAVLSRANRAALYHSLLDGNDGLLKLSEQVARVSLGDMRTLHDIKYNLLNPPARIVGVKAGPQMARDEGNDLDNYSWTIVWDPDVAPLNNWIYCDLFHPDVDQILDYPTPTTSSRPKPLDLKTRRRWIAYCVPDTNNYRNRNWRQIGDIEHLASSLLKHDEGGLPRVDMSRFRLAKILDKRSGLSKDEYKCELEPLWLDAELVEKAPMGRDHIRTYEKALIRAQRVGTLRSRKRTFSQMEAS